MVIWISFALVAALVLSVGYVLAAQALKTYRNLRGPRIVICPETGKPADIELTTVSSAILTALGLPMLGVRNCSRWPERKNCQEDCLKGIDPAEAEEHGLLIRPFHKTEEQP